MSANALERLAVVLVATRNPLNIGAVARALSNFGFGTLRLVNPYEASFREARSAVGASELLARAEEFKSVGEAIADCSLVVGTTAARDRALRHALKPLERAGPIIRKSLSTGRVAILFGSEKRGLSNEDLSHCDRLVRIPTREAHPAMNLGQAVAVCLYELVRVATRAEKAVKLEQASARDRERLGELLCAALTKSGYSQSSQTSMGSEVRRMIRRLELSDADAKTWLGMLRQILWKLERP